MKDSEVKKLIKAKKEGRYAAGNGLYLRISKELSVTWIVRYTVSGHGDKRKRKEVTIGSYPDMSLHQANLKAGDIKEKLKEGEDPMVAKRIQQAIGRQEVANVDELAIEWINHKKKNIKTWWRNERYYNKDIGPKVGLMRPDQVTPLHIKKLVEDVCVFWLT
ncbi:integrase arm-type DNA-binding domain-containing protein [Endozoicomonas sp. SCSIO W0465]|uniref:integrase arm-type DNA-binding domain-containing protein n=1 Tax=Endozoicomonas sp. SCSIO W0465 TaxID=2918516 RepID=UPI002075DA49|nr:integrase arm-type DNA-binding domain-containing protein [Endozoicomonas sp. SCSIO W0465]USE36900.1 integrase arm-type DNA-binding domain-containing protein [Endozoicomonas sp. SCSIO W0465]